MRSVAAVLLAAGDSRRLGAPKALLMRQGETALGRCARLARLAGCDPIVAVLGKQAWWVGGIVERDLTSLGVGIVENTAPELGRTRSLKLGLAAAVDAEAVLAWPVDRPLASEATIARLVGEARRGSGHSGEGKLEAGEVILPVHEGTRGHPLVFAGRALDEVRALGDDEPLHNAVHRDAARLHEMQVADAGVLANLDSAEDAAREGWLVPVDNDARDNTCFVCGPRNPAGLRAQFYHEPAKGSVAASVVAELTLDDRFSGWPGSLIDGVRYALLSDAVVWGAYGLTGTVCEFDGEPRVGNLRSVATGRPFRVEARLTKREGDAITVHAELLQDGALRGTADLDAHLPSAVEIRKALAAAAMPASILDTMRQRLESLEGKR